MEGDAGCAVGILIDLSEPAPIPPATMKLVQADQEENKENCASETAAIEVTREASQEDCHRVDVEDSLKQELMAKKSSAELQPPTDTLDGPLIEDEVYDFDLPMTPERDGGGGGDKSATNDDDEVVFMGPMGFTEKCIAAGVAEEAIQPLSPLRPEQVAELAKEAFSVAHRIALDLKTSMSSQSSQSSLSPTKKMPFCRNLDSVLLTATKDIASRSGASSVSREAAPTPHSAKTLPSPKKRTHHEALSKENSPEAVVTVQGRERSRTFTKDTPTLAKDTLTLTKDTPTLTKDTPTLTKDTPSLRKFSPARRSAAAPAVSSATVTRPAVNKERQSLGAVKGSIPAPGHQKGQSRLQPPSKLRRFNKSQPDLIKSKAAEENAEEASGGQEDSKTSAAVPVIKRSLQPPRASGLPSSRGSKLAQPFTRPSAAAPVQRPLVESGATSEPAPPPSSSSSSSSSSTASMIGRGTGIPKGPATKPQLMQPGQLQLQRKTFGLARPKKSSGPLKAPPPPPPAAVAASQDPPRMGDTVERPYNPLAAASAVVGNAQCPSTPAPQRTVPPRVLSLTSEASTPARSSCSSSSACGSTPGSVNKKMSLLPTSAKRRSTAGSLPSPSPLSVRSSTSSMSARSVASTSDAADSPVFEPRMSSRLSKIRCSSVAKESCSSSDADGPGLSPFAFKPRKALVQNTPELPKRTLSRWSPVRKPKAMPLEDQVSMCTKRTT